MKYRLGDDSHFLVAASHRYCRQPSVRGARRYKHTARESKVAARCWAPARQSTRALVETHTRIRTLAQTQTQTQGRCVRTRTCMHTRVHTRTRAHTQESARACSHTAPRQHSALASRLSRVCVTQRNQVSPRECFPKISRVPGF